MSINSAPSNSLFGALERGIDDRRHRPSRKMTGKCVPNFRCRKSVESPPANDDRRAPVAVRSGDRLAGDLIRHTRLRCSWEYVLCANYQQHRASRLIAKEKSSLTMVRSRMSGHCVEVRTSKEDGREMEERLQQRYPGTVCSKKAFRETPRKGPQLMFEGPADV